MYIRRQILALILSIALIFGILYGADNLVNAIFPGHHKTTTTTKSSKAPKAHHRARPKPHRSVPKVATNAPPGRNAVTISAVGDSDLGTVGDLPADPSTYLDGVKTALSAPIVFGNLEGTLTDSTDSKCGPGSTDCYAFRDPPLYATYFRAAGFTVLNSANNHSHDFGPQGVTDTSAALKLVGIVQAGLPGQIGVTRDAGTKVAFADFAPYSDTNNLLNMTKAKALIEKARTLAPVVIVYMHAGAEGVTADHVTGHDEQYLGEDRGNPEAFAKAAIDDGASAVIASGPHVLRGMQFYKGHLIAYSLGNFVGYNNFTTTGELDLSAILKLHLSATGKFKSASWISLLLNTQGQPSVDTTGEAAVFVNQLSQEDFGASAAKVLPDGSIVPTDAAPSTTSTTSST